MKLRSNEKYLTITVYACAISALTVLCLFLGLNIAGIGRVLSRLLAILAPITAGFIIAYLLNPIVKIFERRVFAFTERSKPRPRLRRALSMTAAYLLLYILVRVLLGLVVPQVVRSYGDLLSRMSEYIAQAQLFVNSVAERLPFINAETVGEKLRSLISGSYDLLRAVIPYISSFAASAVDQVKNVLIGLVLSIYFLFSKERLTGQISRVTRSLTGERFSAAAADFVRMTDRAFGGFIKGKLLDSLIVAALTFVVLAVCRIPYYQLIAVIVGVMNMIPYFGPIIGAVPSAFIIFIADPIKALWFIIIIIVIMQIDGNVIDPRITGESMGLTSLGIIIAITLMSGLFGIPGMFFGVPLFALLLEYSRRAVRAIKEHREARAAARGDGKEDEKEKEGDE